jgi:hypothetical protein
MKFTLFIIKFLKKFEKIVAKFYKIYQKTYKKFIKKCTFYRININLHNVYLNYQSYLKILKIKILYLNQILNMSKFTLLVLSIIFLNLS